MFDRIRFWWAKKPFYAFTNEDGDRVGWAFEKYHWSDDSVTVCVSFRGYVSHLSRMSRALYLKKVEMI